MNRSSTSQRRLIVLALALAASIAVCAVAFAQEGEDEGAGGGGGGGGGGAQAYVVPYTIVLLCVGLGVFVICRSARRRDRPKGEEFKVSSLADIGKKEEIPVIQVGMPMSQVNKLLGKPKVRRRGDDIYREAARAGKLSEKDAAKEHLTYDHPAGQYKLVAFDRRVIEIKTQPKRKEEDAS
jgi:hypothetical protein